MALPAIWYLHKDGSELQRQKRKFEEQQRNKLEECVYNFEKQERELKTSDRYSDDLEIELDDCGSDLTQQGIELKKCGKKSQIFESDLKKKERELKKCGKKSQIFESDLTRKKRELKKCEDKSKFEDFVPCAVGITDSVTTYVNFDSCIFTGILPNGLEQHFQFECQGESDGSFEVVTSVYHVPPEIGDCSGSPTTKVTDQAELTALLGFEVTLECTFCEKK